MFAKKTKNKITTFYKITMVAAGPTFLVKIYQLDPFENLLYFKSKYDIEVSMIDRFGQYVKKDLINDGFCWLKNDGMDIICKTFGWARFEHFTECKRCKNFKFVPFMNFYTGCTICNKLDHGSYTYFEAEKKSNQLNQQ